LVGIQRAHVELYIRGLGESGLMASSINTMMHGMRGFFRFAHIDGLIPADPAVYARLPKVHRDESRTQGLDRLELIRFLQVAQTISVHHGALAYLLGINALRASEAAAVRIEHYAETLRGHRVLHLVGTGNKPATMPLTVLLRVLEACRGERTAGPLVLRPLSGKPIDRRDAYRMVARIAKTAGIPRHISPHSLRHAAITDALDAGVPLRDAQILARHADPRTTEHYDRAAATSTATASTS
jgi:integrase/recombinase XerD